MSPLPTSLPNPFLSNIVDDPWKQTAVSVPTIHQTVFDSCRQVVDYVRAEGRGAGILIHGQPGSGKTHLLARLREQLDQGITHPDLNHPRQVFISVRLATSPQHIWRHVRERLVDDLLRRQSNGLSQLEMLMAARFARDEQAEGDLAQWWEFFRDERPERLEDRLENWAFDSGVGSQYKNVLLHLIRGTHRFAARSWLRGESLPDADLQRLGLPIAGENDDPMQPEVEAHDVVIWTCHLAGAGLPIVFCFDQVEALQRVPGDLRGLFQFGQLASDLHDQTPNAVLISCIQSDFLSDLLTIVSGYARDRIKSFGQQVLSPLTKSEAEELVRARLEFSPHLEELRANQADPLWPFSESDIESFLGKAGCTPRELISQSADRFRRLQGMEVKTLRPDQFLPPIWESRLEKAIQTNSPEKSEHILADGLPMLLDTVAKGWQVTDDDPLRDVDFVLTGPDCESRVGVSFCTQQNMTSLAARLRRLQEQMDGFHKFILIRDDRTPISKNARKAREHLADLEKADAVLYRPSLEAMAALDALRQLLADADSGDLSVDNHTIPTDTVQDWLADHLASALADMRDALIGYPHTLEFGPTDAHLDELMELMNAEHVLAVEEAASRLDWPPERVESVARENPQQVGLLQGPPAVLFQPLAAGLSN